MLTEGSPTIADIDRLRAEAKQARMRSQGWPDDFRATILNMVEREPYFLQSAFGPKMKEQIDILTRPRDENNEDQKRESWDTVEGVFIWMKAALEYKEGRQVAKVERLKQAARVRGQNTRAEREEAERAEREEAERAAREPPAPAPAPAPAPQPYFPIYASAPPGDDGGRRRRRRSTRRGKKSRRISKKRIIH
jgi:hypothetical protein